MIVEATRRAGVSVAAVAQAHGVNANQVVYWRKLHDAGQLECKPPSSPGVVEPAHVCLLPVSVEGEQQPPLAAEGIANQRTSSPSSEGSSELTLARGQIALQVRSMPERYALSYGVCWHDLSSGEHADMDCSGRDGQPRRGFTGLSALVQTALEQAPLSGHVFVFRGRRGDLIRLLWFDGDGLCLFSKKLERGRFVSSQAESGKGSPPRTQLRLSTIARIFWHGCVYRCVRPCLRPVSSTDTVAHVPWTAFISGES